MCLWCGRFCYALAEVKKRRPAADRCATDDRWQSGGFLNNCWCNSVFGGFLGWGGYVDFMDFAAIEIGQANAIKGEVASQYGVRFALFLVPQRRRVARGTEEPELRATTNATHLAACHYSDQLEGKRPQDLFEATSVDDAEIEALLTSEEPS